MNDDFIILLMFGVPFSVIIWLGMFAFAYMCWDYWRRGR